MPQAVDDLAEIQKIIKDNDLVFVDIGASKFPWPAAVIFGRRSAVMK